MVKALIEGTELDVCSNCARFGKILHKPNPAVIEKAIRKKQMPKKEEPDLVIVPDYGRIIKEKRERKGLKQEELAKAISERESLIQKIESGHLEPSIRLARKLESFLKIRLVEEYQEKRIIGQDSRSGTLTIGDLIKKR